MTFNLVVFIGLISSFQFLFAFSTSINFSTISFFGFWYDFFMNKFSVFSWDSSTGTAIFSLLLPFFLTIFLLIFSTYPFLFTGTACFSSINSSISSFLALSIPLSWKLSNFNILLDAFFSTFLFITVSSTFCSTSTLPSPISSNWSNFTTLLGTTLISFLGIPLILNLSFFKTLLGLWLFSFPYILKLPVFDILFGTFFFSITSLLDLSMYSICGACSIP